MASVWQDGAWGGGAWLSGAWLGDDQAQVVGGRRQRRGDDGDYELYRDYWDSIEAVRRPTSSSRDDELPDDDHVVVRVSDDGSGAVTEVSIPIDMPVPPAVLRNARAMRGIVEPGVPPMVVVADILDDPVALAALVMLLDEADD